MSDLAADQVTLPQANKLGRNYAGAFWRWLTADNNAVPQRFEIIVEHRNDNERLVWGITHMVGNLFLFVAAGAVAASAILVLTAVLGLFTNHPELLHVGTAYLSRKVDAWEMAHGFACTTWQTEDEQTHREISFSGGPGCTPPATPPLPPANNDTSNK